MKTYPNHTMMGELQDRLIKLKEAFASCPSKFAVKRKIEDLEEMLMISDLQRKLKHQRSVSASLPSSSSMKECVAKTEALLAAAVGLRPAAAVVLPAPGRDPAQDEVREKALPRLAKAKVGHPSLGSPAQKVCELQTQVDGLQYNVEQLQSKVAELSKKRHASFVSVQHFATNNYVPIQKRFQEEILKDRVKLLDFVQSALKKKGHEDFVEDDVPDEDTIVKAPALVRDGILVHTKDAPEVADNVESTEEQCVPDVVIKEMNKDEVDVNMECDGYNKREQSVSEASIQVGLDKVTNTSGAYFSSVLSMASTTSGSGPSLVCTRIPSRTKAGALTMVSSSGTSSLDSSSTPFFLKAD